jgi:hypothetical protein
MTEYQQADTLVTGSDVPFAGAGSYSATAPDGGSGYTAWQWEVVLATVLGLAIPGRDEVTGVPWLTVAQNGQGAAGLHLIWSADWNTKPMAGGESLQVYLNPDVYTAGGPWDQFSTGPARPMSEVAAQNFSALPLDPGTFGAASGGITSVTTMLAGVASQFRDLSGQATGDNSGFHGNMAEVVGQLLAGLGSTAQNLHDQLTEPASYSASVSAAGDAAATFLTSIESAYNGWLAVPEHSPLGAVVQVLKEIATQDPTGAWVISDPQHTSYGDLTTAAVWPAVEQQAKIRWLAALTGEADFAGLDPLARSALSNLVGHYETTTSVIVPVIGPAPPSARPDPVGNKGVRTGNGGNGPAAGGTSGGPGLRPAAAAAILPPGTGTVPAGQAGPVALAGQQSNLASTATGVPGSGASAPPPSGSSAPALTVLATAPALAVAGAVSLSGQPGASRDQIVAAASLPGDLGSEVMAGAVALAGPIGAVPNQPRAAETASGPAASPLPAAALPIGVLGLPDEAAPSKHGRRSAADHEDRHGHSSAAPEAGLAIGRDPATLALKRRAAGVTAAVASSPGAVNTDLVPITASGPAGAGPGPAGAGPAGGPLTGQQALPVTGQASPVTGQASPAAGASGTGSASQGVAGPDGEPMLMMPGLAAGGGLRDQERQRLAYLPQEEEYWGTGRAPGRAAIGAQDVSEPAEPDFEKGQARHRIGDQGTAAASEHTRPDRRNP